MNRKRLFNIISEVAQLAIGLLIYFFILDSVNARAAEPIPVVRPSPFKSPTIIIVEAFYPGANAEMIAKAVAAPIEKEVNGIEGMTSMSSLSSSDGTYKLSIAFKEGVDLDQVQTLVKKRIGRAVLPSVVQREGISVKKKPSPILMFVTLSSQNKLYDAIDPRNFTVFQIRNELLQTPGVADVDSYNFVQTAMRIAIDPERLRAYELKLTEVVGALEKAPNIHLRADDVKRLSSEKEDIGVLPIVISVKQSSDLDEIGKIKINEKRHVNLADVCYVTDDQPRHSWTSYDGSPTLSLGIYPLSSANPTDLRAAVEKRIKDWREKVPKGDDLKVSVDFTSNLTKSANAATPQYLSLNMYFPDGITIERSIRQLKQCDDAVRKTPGVTHTFALAEPPCSRASILVTLAPAATEKVSRKQVAQTLRAQLPRQMPDALLRICEPVEASAYPFSGFPIDFVIEDRNDAGQTALARTAELLAEKLKMSGKLADVYIETGKNLVQMATVEINADKATALGVYTSNVSRAIKATFGKIPINASDETKRLTILIEKQPGDLAKKIGELKVRDSDGKRGSLIEHCVDTS